jgi:hypothetical protein
MKAIRVHRYGGPEVLELEDIQPQPRPLRYDRFLETGEDHRRGRPISAPLLALPPPAGTVRYVKPLAFDTSVIDVRRFP